MSAAPYMPTPQTVWSEAARIRAAWSPAERLRRQAAAPSTLQPPSARILLPREQLDALLSPVPCPLSP